jgi:hypothetical protein
MIRSRAVIVNLRWEASHLRRIEVTVYVQNVIQR